jgi:hypothetical protein
MGFCWVFELPRAVANRAQVADITRSIAAERDRIRQTLESKAVVAKLARSGSARHWMI